ncbi:MAG: hypothetical protein AAGA61_08315 [Pseudomonadota bacterium]
MTIAFLYRAPEYVDVRMTTEAGRSKPTKTLATVEEESQWKKRRHPHFGIGSATMLISLTVHSPRTTAARASVAVTLNRVVRTHDPDAVPG